MHRLSTSFVLGYHGCDVDVAEALLAGEPFKKSNNDYDWLGPGVYFWEANPQRGYDFANEAAKRKGSKIKHPTVIGAVIDLGLCLDMTTLGAIGVVKQAYQALREQMQGSGNQLPVNGKGLLLRHLDCAVIKTLHDILKTNDEAFDTVRGVFIEGEPLYLNSGFNDKTHTQIAVCNLACIKGVFRVSSEQFISDEF